MSFATGFGPENSLVCFYIANRPPIDDYPEQKGMKSLEKGEIEHIVRHTSNHWRKAFNVYAKVMFAWGERSGRVDLPDTWQALRDSELFQPHSGAAMLFSAPDLDKRDGVIHVVCGKTHAATLNLPSLIWIDDYFAVNKNAHVIVCPYPDYRQLSNSRIDQLLSLMADLSHTIVESASAQT